MSNRDFVLASLFLVFGLITTVSAAAGPFIGTESISTVLDGDGVFDQHYPNHFDPDHPKELWFNGQANILPDQNGRTFLNQLFLQFDWLDPLTGQEALSDQFVFPVDPSAPIDAHWTLPFCPEEVSLHLFAEVFDGGVISVDGTFIHECIVPEPTNFLAWSLLGITGFAAGRRRRRVR